MRKFFLAPLLAAALLVSTLVVAPASAFVLAEAGNQAATSDPVQAVLEHRQKFSGSNSKSAQMLRQAVNHRLNEAGLSDLVGAWAFEGKCRDPLSRFYLTGSEQIFAYLGREKKVKLLHLREDAELEARGGPLGLERFAKLSENHLAYINATERRLASRCEPE